MNYAGNKNANNNAIGLKIALSYPISWSKISLFLQCPRCFFNDQKLGIKHPNHPDADIFNMPNAMDAVWKKESDRCRALQTVPDVISKNKLNLALFDDAKHSVAKWRQAYYDGGGILYHDPKTNLTLFGRVDDIWVNPQGELIVVDIKVTSPKPRTNQEENKWHKNNIRQISFYAWLLKKLGFNVAMVGYIIYCNPLTEDLTALPFDNCLHFKTSPLLCVLDDSWIEKAIEDMRYCLDQDNAPEPTRGCSFCNFAQRAYRPKTSLSQVAIVT